MDSLKAHVQRLAQEALGKPLSPNEALLRDFCATEASSALFIFEHDARLVMRSTVESGASSDAVLALVKQGPINLKEPLHTQIYPIAVPGGESAESLHQIVHHVLSPYFEASAGGLSTASANINAARQKIAELELSFHNLQFHTEIQLLQLAQPPLPSEGEEPNLNALQNTVNEWKKSIRGVVRVTRDPRAGTASEEVLFWRSMENALQHIEDQLKAPEVRSTIQLLEQGKRFHATVSFPADTGLPEALDQVQKYNVVLKELPIEDLLLSKDLKSIASALEAVFGHISKKLRPSSYPVWRAIALVEAISGDLARVLAESTPKILALSKPEFDSLVAEIHHVFLMWEDLQREFTNLARDVIRKRGEKFIPVRIQVRFAAFRDRLEYLEQFRQKHEELVESFRGALNTEALVQLQALFVQMAASDVLDTSPEGVAQWNVFETNYNTQAAAIESEAAKVLKAQLDEAQSATEMFRIFTKFQSLLGRPAIRSAIHEYQARLLQVVKSEISALQGRVAKRYNHSFASRTAAFYDVPSVSGLVIWLGQIRHRLDELLQKLEAILGPSWQTYAEGQQLANECAEFRAKIETRPVIDAWIGSLSLQSPNEFVLGLKQERLVVKFDAETGQLFKELAALQAMGVHVPHTFTAAAQASRASYPLAIRLIEGLKVVHGCEEQLSGEPRAKQLVTRELNATVRVLAGAADLTWKSLQYDSQFVTALDSAVAALDSRTDLVLRAVAEVRQLLLEFDRCAFERSAFEQLLERISAVGIEVDPAEAASKLAERAVTELRALGGAASLYTHNLTLSGQEIVASPPLSATRSSFFAEVTRVIAQIDMLPVDATVWSAAAEAVAHIQSTLEDASDHVATWLQFQGLWDLKPETVWSQLESLASWQQLLQELVHSRSKMDTVQKFGRVRILSHSIHAHVSSKYDQWQNLVVDKFAEVVGAESTRFLGDVRARRTAHEEIAFYTGSSELLATFLQTVLGFDEQATRATLSSLSECQLLLVAQRFQFPKKWTFVDQLKSELEALMVVHQQRRQELDQLRDRLRDETRTNVARLQAKIKALIEQWQLNKPVSGSIKPEDAIFAITRFDAELSGHVRSATTYKQISELLGLGLDVGSPLDVCEEIKDFLSAWNAVATAWESLRLLEARKWSDVVPRAVRQALAELLEQTQNMPSRIRQYAAFQHVQGVVRDRVKALPLLSSLASPAMKARHWETLGGSTARSSTSATRTLGDVWALDLLANKVAIERTVKVAEGEHTIEQALAELGTFWAKFPVALVAFNKTLLIKNWNDLFAKLEEHSNSLSAMQSSACYKPFAQQAQEWSARVQRMHSLFDGWVQVQQQWVYLFGVFGAADVRHVLPAETAKFNSVNGELQVIYKLVAKSPGVLEVCAIPEIDATMARIGDLLSKLQRALGDYFERQRQEFGRFYFVGDDDLLEMVGEFSERVGRHLPKMFAGVAALEIEGAAIVGVRSSEGELLPLRPVATKGTVTEVLRLVEAGIVASLKELTLNAVDSLDLGDLFGWLEAQPLQVSLLALRISYTRGNQRGEALQSALSTLATKTLEPLDPLVRLRLEGVITELVHLASSPSTLEYHLQPDGTLVVRRDAFESPYGWEYQGAPQQLVQTPLIDSLFLTMTQALAHGFGGSPFGPAGTGKTEGVKALGQALGMFVVVFCCDESFDFGAITRLLAGICQTGAWACFDEFNRLESTTLSSVSTHVAEIEHSLMHKRSELWLNRKVELAPSTALFVTMNPAYIGRNQLPDNMKNLFRSFAMTYPDKAKILEVMLYSQGFRHAEALASRIIELFEQLAAQCSQQPHYDWGLRALKSVLRTCGTLRRSMDAQSLEDELKIVHLAHEHTIVPKLLKGDLAVFRALVPLTPPSEDSALSAAAGALATPGWLTKLHQLERFLGLHHGVMLVGGTAGKTSCWQTLAKAHEAEIFRIDPKTASKEQLYGKLDVTTREWTDGLFTAVLRRISARNLTKPCWIVFDGEIDPDWAENLNSVLDDNKLLTLPSGERLPLPPNVRLLFEVSSLKAATPATVSRCGMVWFDGLDPEVVAAYEMRVFSERFEEPQPLAEEALALAQRLDLPGLCAHAAEIEHIMPFSHHRALTTFFSLLQSQVEAQLVDAAKVRQAAVWAFAGDSNAFASFSEHLGADMSLKINENGSVPWHDIPVDLEPHDVADSALIIPTRDTARLEALMSELLSVRTPILLCGPPGAGKTMILLSSLRSSRSAQQELVCLNFSKTTQPEAVLAALEEKCVYKQHNGATVLEPAHLGQWVVLFCDEINLPAQDKYGHQRALCLVRQLIERRGFYKGTKWVSLNRVQIVGACNPPTDVGRLPLDERVLRHCALVHVDHPRGEALHHIYRTICGATLKAVPDLRGSEQELSTAMIAVYERCAELSLKREHYVYSPRELTRWAKGIYIAIKDRHDLEWDGLVRAWLHEGWRLFGDRLVEPQEKERMWQQMVECAPPHSSPAALEQPILFSDWLNKEYCSVEREPLADFLRARMRVFNEEVAEKPLTLYDDMIEHILRINRVLRQPQGHMILVGVSASGKTTMTKFVCWMNGIATYQLQTSRNYTEESFLSDLRAVLKQAGCEGRKTCLLLDESNLLGSSFIEKMNTLLANSEIPGLFGHDELLDECRRGSAAHGLNLADDDDLLRWFSQQIARNLHVVFTMSSDPSGSGTIRMSSSPALFNRCVLNWMGDWSQQALEQVARDQVAELAPIALRVHLMVQQHYAATPGEFLAFLEQYRALYRERRVALESQQRHFNVGVDKLKGTMLEVKQLRRDLDVKGAQLGAKDAESRKMLQHILNEQSEAERRREAGINIRAALEVQAREIEQHKARVYENLALAEPAVLDAKRGVSNIKKQHLNELRAFTNPPDAVKQTLEAVCFLLGLKHSTWREVLQAVRSEEFIPSIVGYDGREMSESTLRHLRSGFLSRLSYEQVDRASKACGPLQQWVAAQVVYATTVKEIEPLELQVQELEQVAAEKQAQENAINEMLGELEQGIEDYKVQYSELIAETQTIKAEIALVQQRLATSVDLVAGLESEKQRWIASIAEFDKRQQTLVGSCVLAAAYLTYAGRLDQAQRSALLASLKQSLGIPFAELNLVSAAQRLEWKIYSDTLSLDNSAMLARHIRTPFIIDPSGKVLQLLKDAQITSFLDNMYSKHVESAMRFGSTLVVRNAEQFDAALMPLLNQEYVRHGGRSTLNIFGHDIDVNRDFKIYLVSEDPHVALLPHVAARCTVVNFTITRNSLEHLTLDRVLVATKPELEAERRQLWYLQGEYEVELHRLEVDLLAILNEAQGNILDSLEVIKSLDTLKQKAAETAAKAEAAAKAMAEVEATISEFVPVAELCGAVYGVCERLELLDSNYLVTLDTFLRLFDEALLEFGGVDALKRKFVHHFYSELSVSLLEDDRAALRGALNDVYGEEELAFSTNDDWEAIVAKSPVCLFAVQDLDPTLRLQSMSPGLKIVALGSSEGEANALKLLQTAAKQGHWVLVQNLEMAPTWMDALGRVLKQPAHPQFRALFTMQFASSVPAHILSQCRVIAVERPRGVKSGLKSNMLKIQTSEPPAERARIMLCLAWLHALLQERQRLHGGWNGNYDFNDFDLDFAAQLVRDQLAQFRTRANVSPEAINWTRLRTLLLTSVYGAKVDNKKDLEAISAMIEHSLSPAIYELDYLQSMGCPDTRTPELLDQLSQWTETLEEKTEWIGLEQDAEELHQQSAQEAVARKQRTLL